MDKDVKETFDFMTSDGTILYKEIYHLAGRVSLLQQEVFALKLVISEMRDKILPLELK
jgi:hypothetical protein